MQQKIMINILFFFKKKKLQIDSQTEENKK